MNNMPVQRFEINKAGVAPAAGGVNTNFEKPQLELGGYSVLENVRITGTGLELRPGLTVHNQTAEAAAVHSLYSYRPKSGGALSFFAQLSDGDVYVADENPPTGAGANDFGSVVMDYSALKGDSTGSVIPASWSKHIDTVVHSNGAMQHVVWPGPSPHPLAVFMKNSASALERVVEGGVDLTNILTDEDDGSQTATYTFTIANYDGLWIMTPFKASSFTFDMGTVVADGTTTIKVQYFDGDDMADATTGADGTSGWQQDGTITFTKGTTEYPTFMFGQAGYWYRVYLSAGDATETVSFVEVTYTGDWQIIENVMSSTPQYIVEAAVEGATDAEYFTYPASAIVLNDLAIGDYLYFATTTPIWAVLVDVGATPNMTNGTTITGLQGWTNASGWASVSNLEDNTNGLENTGVISWQRGTWDKQAFNGGLSHLYWWRVNWDSVMTDNVTISLQTIGDFNIKDLGISGKVSTVWKDRGCYTFGKFSRDIYVSAKGRLNVLNGDDFAILSPGDGRRNEVVAMKSFHNELMVWQKEEGADGGCLTIFEGYSPATFGRLVLSTRLGTFSQKTAVVVDGSLMTTRKDDVTQTIAFFISHYGVFMTDGRVVRMISGDIQNYFDPSNAECITSGQEDKMWIGFDNADKVLRLGLVSGSGQTKCNVFPVYSIDDDSWSFDTFPTGADQTGIYPQCFTEVEAASGSAYSLQYLGCNYGRVYRSTRSITYDKAYTTNVYITGKLRAEFSNGGNFLDFRELVLRSGSNADYTLTKKIYENGVLDSNETETYDMGDDDSGLTFRERILQRNYNIFHLSVELTWQDTEAGGNAAPKLYDFLYEVYSEIQKG